MTACVFPGQGAQRVGMGAGLFEQFPRLTALADDILGYSIRTLCLADPYQQLNRTEYTQPALYVVACLDYLRTIQTRMRRPEYVAGHSLGEYAALFAAGAFDFAIGLRLVQRRGALMAQARGGCMAAVVGLRVEQVAHVLAQHQLSGLAIANDNAPTQVVISGLRGDIEQAQPLFERAGAQRYVLLDVSGAFHSPQMRAAQAQFADWIAHFSFSEPILPVIGNVDARPYQQGQIKQRLVQQITERVRWRESIWYLMEQGETLFEERADSRILRPLIEQIQAERTAMGR
jgi:malonyl CoA-acyl carrier protein transacylase